jgi:predicted Rdx family selenoprotein
VAQTLKDTFDLTTTLTPGNRGEFTVWIDSKKIIEKTGDDFPPEDKIVSAVSQMIA